MSLLGYLDFLTRDDPTQNFRPLLRHLLNTGRFHALTVPCRLAAGKAAVECEGGAKKGVKLYWAKGEGESESAKLKAES